jgi:hypothetical protein
MFVPLSLENNQKQRHINVRLELWEKANEDTTFISGTALFPKSKIKLKGRHFESVRHPIALKKMA